MIRVSKIKNGRGAWPTQLIGHVTLDLWAVNSSPTRTERLLKKKKLKMAERETSPPPVKIRECIY